MNISALFIHRPVMTTLVMLSILLFGITGYLRLPVSDLPDVDFPTILVAASLPGASPENMASSVATPLEREFSTISGLDSMNSSSSLGMTQITLQFNIKRNIDAAAQDVQAAISRAATQLPSDMPSPPSYKKVNPADQPILYLALTSPTLPLYTLDEYGETLLAQRISMIGGVAQVIVYGSQKYAVRIQLDPNTLASRGIGIDEVAAAVRNANVNLPTGTLYGTHRAFTVKATGQLDEAKAYGPIIVAYRNGQPLRLRDIGEAVDSVENDKTAAWFGDQRSLILAIQRQPGANTVEVADAVKNLLPAFEAQLPGSVSLKVIFDRSESVRASVNDIKFTLVFALLLVVVVIFLFLRNLAATLIPSLAMPMSIIGTFSVMYLLGYSLDNLSLMALILSVGFVVDDAIVMFENAVRHMELGESGFDAAMNGSKEVSFTILSMTLSLAAVFIPVLFMGGILGRLFREFAVSIGVAVLVSGFVSLTLTPMLCSRFLRRQQAVQHGRLYLLSERLYQGMLRTYEQGLKWFLQHRWTTIMLLLIILSATIFLFKRVPKGFIPAEDRGQIFSMTEAAQGISWDAMREHQMALGDIVRQDPNVESYISSAGARAGSITGSNSGFIFMRLRAKPERKLTVDQVMQQLRPKLTSVPGIRVFMQNLPLIRLGAQLSKSQYQYTLQSTNTQELYHYASLLADKIRGLPGLIDVTTDMQIKNPQVNVEIDRDKAAALGISAEEIEEALYSAYGTREVSTIYGPTNEYKVIMQLKPRYQLAPDALSKLYIRSSGGQLVPLDTVARLTENLGPLTINHTDQLPSVTISFNLEPEFPLGDAVKAVDRLAYEMLPATISTSFQGAAQAFQSSMQGLGLLLIVAILVIYMVLGILYESFIHPLTILSALPLAGFGALITLMLFGAELNLYSFVGLIMLVGLVKKNGIIMIDFAIEAQRTGNKTPMDAIYEACVVRFRPIMMTTMAALMGSLPIAIGFGAGAEARRPLGLAVVGGLLFSQFLTLFITPVFYLHMESLRQKLGKKRSTPEMGRRYSRVEDS
jgi:HAE1 family hydrophobic/amphiphilic exporter-1